MIGIMLLCSTLAHAETVADAYPPPKPSVRYPAEGFGAWVQQRPVAPEQRPITTFDGRVVHHEGRVIQLPLVSGDLQQCADSAIRLRAEWLREGGHPITFHATSGDPIDWTTYQFGQRPYESEGHIAWKPGGDGSWESYLRWVFMWAGTRSLAYDTVPVSEPHPGDLLVNPGSPGHAVVLLDVAKHGEDTYVLVGEGYMPAQSFHVEHGPHQGWWRYNDGVQLPHWWMPATGLRRFKDP